MIDLADGPRTRIERLRARHPSAVDLATLCSLAVRVEPELLRRLRLLLPGADVTAEADLWTTDLLSGASPRGISLDPTVADQLRLDLRSPRWDGLRSRARDVIATSHAEPLCHWSLRLEEQLHHLAVEGAPAERSEELVLGAVERLVTSRVDAERTGIARWLLAMLARLPGGGSDATTAARLAAGVHLGGRVPEPAGSVDDRWFPWLLGQIGAPPVTVRVGFAPGRVALEPLDERAATILVPATDPLVVDLDWHDGRATRSVRLRFAAGEHVVVPVTSDQVDVTTLAGDRFSLRRAGVLRGGAGFDFAAARARTRPCLARGRLLPEVTNSGAWWTILSGSAGIGKTVLACAAADRLERRGSVVAQHFYGLEPAWDEPATVAASIEGQLRTAVPGAPWQEAETDLEEPAQRLQRALATAARGADGVVLLVDGIPGGSIDETKGWMFQRAPWPSKPPEGVTYLVTARHGGGVRDWLEDRDPTRLIHLDGNGEAEVCLAMLDRHGAGLRAAFGIGLDDPTGGAAATDVPHRDELLALAGTNPGRLDGILGWLLDQPVAAATTAGIPRSLTVALGRAWIDLEDRFDAAAVQRWLGCVVAARPGFTIADLRRLTAPAEERLVLDLIEAAVELGILCHEGALTADASGLSAHPSLIPTFRERYGPEALQAGHAEHVRLFDGTGDGVGTAGTYAIANVVHHVLEAGRQRSGDLGIHRSGAFLHRRATEGGAASVVEDLRTVLRGAPEPDPDVETLLRAAERIERIAAPRPDRFVELLVNELRSPENEGLVAELLAEAWPTGVTFRSLLRVGGRGPQWQVDRLTVAAVPLGDGRLASVGPAGLTITGSDVPPRATVRIGPGPVAAVNHDGGVVVGLPFEVAQVDVDAAAVLRRVPVAGPLTALGSVAGRIVAGARSGVVTVVPRTGPIRTLVGHGAEITSIGQVRDTLLTSGMDGTVRRWDLDTGALMTAFRHRHAVRRVLGLASGEVVSADDAGRISWWAADTGEHVRLPRGHDGPVTALLEAGDGRSVLSAGRDGRIWRRTVDDDSLVADVGPAVLLAAMLDPQMLVTWDESRVLTWRDLGGRVLGRIRPRGYCPSASALVTDTERGLVVIVHAEGMAAYPPPTAFDDPGEHPFLRQLAVTEDGEIAVGSPAGVLRIPPDGATSTAGTAAPIGLGYVGKDGRLLAAWTDGGLDILQRGAAARPVFPGERPARLVAATGSTAAVAFDDDRVRVMITGSNVESGFTARVEHATSLAVVDTEAVVVGDSHGRVCLARPGMPVLIAPAGQSAVTAVVGMAAGIVAGTADGAVLRWRPDESGMVTMGRHDGPIAGLAQLSGRFALSASADATIRVWDVENGIEWAVLAGPAPFHAVASADGGLPVVVRSGADAVWRIEVAIPKADEPPPLVANPAEDPSSSALRLGSELHRSMSLSAVSHCEIRAVRLLLPGLTESAFDVSGVAFDAEGRFRERLTPDGRLAVPRRMRPGGSTQLWVSSRSEGTGDASWQLARSGLRLTVATPTRRDEVTYDLVEMQPMR